MGLMPGLIASVLPRFVLVPLVHPLRLVFEYAAREDEDRKERKVEPQAPRTSVNLTQALLNLGFIKGFRGGNLDTCTHAPLYFRFMRPFKNV
jgi:hypothetical protein